MLDVDFKHLKKIKSNYFKHLYIAMKFNLIALLVFITGTIHAFVPFLFAFTPYKLAKMITDGTEKTFKKEEDDL